MLKLDDKYGYGVVYHHQYSEDRSGGQVESSSQYTNHGIISDGNDQGSFYQSRLQVSRTGIQVSRQQQGWISKTIMDVLKSIARPDELMALVKFKFGGANAVKPKQKLEAMSGDLKTCYMFLNKTSRSFAAVIQALDGELRDAVCLFYLVLRALDTVEDDMTIPVSEKIPMLQAFHTYLLDPQWCYMKSQEKDRMVLERFPVISGEFRKLKPIYRDVISDICKRMGQGMTEYLEKAPDSAADWDQYCHYVAGLVGIGLSRLFSASNLESSVVGEDTRLANSMGLFLQKTNIIRDYLEDVVQGRLFWPKEVWSQYCDELPDLAKPEKLDDAVMCLNHLVTNALQHVPDVVTYMSRIQNQSVFNFCAIPQVMAIATLERCYNNAAVFSGVVKIRKGEAVRMMMEATDIDNVKAILHHFSLQIRLRIPRDTHLTAQTNMAVQRALNASRTEKSYQTSVRFPPIYVSAAMLTTAIVWNYWTSIMSYMEDVTA